MTRRRRRATPGARVRRWAAHPAAKAVVFGVGAFVAGYLFVALVLYGGADRERYVAIPDLRGKQVAEVRRILDRLDLRVEVGDSLTHPEVAAGAVLAHVPLAGHEVRPGTEVRVTLSAGRARARVPDVSALSGKQAEEVLTRAGFRVATSEQSDMRAAGRIVELVPAPGTVVEMPAALRLVVSTGPPRVAVPDLAGMDEQEAREALDDARLRLGQVGYDPLAFRAYGRIFAQRPAPGDSVVAHSAVSVTIAGFPPIRGTEPDSL